MGRAAARGVAVALLTAAPLLGGCAQSLFDEGKSVTEPDPIGAACPADCLADAARDFDGTVGGKDGTWRYLDDHRDRTWTPMTPDAGKLVGADAGLTIASCGKAGAAPACAMLPGALLVSTTGAISAADPALEFTVASKRSVQIDVRTFVPADAVAQQLYIYRNSREDLLFAGPAAPGELARQTLAADVIPGDRLLVALVPASGGAADVGLEVFISDVGAVSKCQVALDFASNSQLLNACGAAFSAFDYDNGDIKITPTLGPGPFPELGSAAVITPGKYYKGTELLDKSGDVTIQYWLKVAVVDTTYGAWPFSDMDLNSGGGFGNAVYDQGGTRFDTSVGTADVSYLGQNVVYPGADKWQFVRVVHTAGVVSTCLNGRRVSSFDLPAGMLTSGFPPYLAKNVRWTPAGAFFDGSIDDVRVVSAALPCE